ncbi:hypothetical protein ACKI16_29480 [Streptomyces scabiei]|uniref:hypothetical protein n=1 Tax=Streptomyces scabiei TaxID=1930 RepID=UPI0038F6470E
MADDFSTRFRALLAENLVRVELTEVRTADGLELRFNAPDDPRCAGGGTLIIRGGALPLADRGL